MGRIGLIWSLVLIVADLTDSLAAGCMLLGQHPRQWNHNAEHLAESRGRTASDAIKVALQAADVLLGEWPRVGVGEQSTATLAN